MFKNQIFDKIKPIKDNEIIFIITINTIYKNKFQENQYIITIKNLPDKNKIKENFGFKTIVSDSETLIIQEEITQKKLLKKIFTTLLMNLKE